MTLSIALKEWDLVIRALLAGEQSMLLRKGGILEAEGEFVLEHQRFLLFPTVIHQDPAGVKPRWRDGVTQQREEPEKITISGWAEVARIWEIPNRARFETLDDLHIWDRPLIDMRFSYRPDRPLYLVAVQAYALAAPIVLPNLPAFAGCKSWVPLDREIPIEETRPAISKDLLAERCARIDRAFA
jgi:hypothetical protein